MNNKRLLTGLMALVISGQLLANNSGIENSIEVKQLSLASAIQAADVSISSCRKKGHQVAATVVDSHGQVQVVLRDTHASLISLEFSQKKAYTAANFKKNTAQLAHLADTAIGRSEGVLMSAGGVLIKVDDIIYGAVGVSGSSSGKSDNDCANAGAEALVEALKADLEKGDKTPEETKSPDKE